MNACWGAWPSAYTDWFVNDGGVSPHEGSYPYLGKYPNFNCNKARRVRKWNSGAKVVKAINDYSCNEAKLKKMIYEQGAVIVGVEELQPISVAGNPVGQCLSFKLLKTHPQSHLGQKITLSCFKINAMMSKSV